MDRRLGGPQSRSGRGGEEKNSQPPLGIEPPIIPLLAQSYTTELSRLLCKFFYLSKAWNILTKLKSQRSFKGKFYCRYELKLWHFACSLKWRTCVYSTATRDAVAQPVQKLS
jgi:hypothetical protein